MPGDLCGAYLQRRQPEPRGCCLNLSRAMRCGNGLVAFAVLLIPVVLRSCTVLRCITLKLFVLYHAVFSHAMPRAVPCCVFSCHAACCAMLCFSCHAACCCGAAVAW
jgi:hypothetical protein